MPISMDMTDVDMHSCPPHGRCGGFLRRATRKFRNSEEAPVHESPRTLGCASAAILLVTVATVNANMTKEDVSCRAAIQKSGSKQLCVLQAEGGSRAREVGRHDDVRLTILSAPPRYWWPGRRRWARRAGTASTGRRTIVARSEQAAEKVAADTASL